MTARGGRPDSAGWPKAARVDYSKYKACAVPPGLTEAVASVAALRAEGKTVLLHCVQAQSRTPAVAACMARGSPAAP